MIRGVRQQGIALISAIALLVIIFALVSTGLILNTADIRRSKDNNRTVRSQYAAEAGIDHAVNTIWHVPKKLAEVAGVEGVMPVVVYRQLLNGDANLNDVLDPGEKPIILPGPPDADPPVYGPPLELSGDLDKSGSQFKVLIQRKDAGQDVFFRMIASGAQDNASRYIQQMFVLRGNPTWDFAMLTDNIRCVFCHFDVYPIEVGYRSSGELRNFFTDDLTDIATMRRVRIGSISDMSAADPSWADSYIAGTVYARRNSNFDSAEIYGARLDADGKLRGGSSFNTTFALYKDLSKVNCSDLSLCSPYQSRYTRYPTKIADQLRADGQMPTSFPSPVKDQNSDRIIDDDEWENTANNDGVISIATSRNYSQVLSSYNRGGMLAVARGSSLNQAQSITRFESAFKNSKTPANDRHEKTNLVLRGVTGNPIEVTGRVYVDGDVVISGRIKGEGMIIARGNVYIVGDIVYECDTPSTECNYSLVDELPRFGLAAGGSILTGRYFLSFNGSKLKGLLSNSDMESLQAPQTNFGPPKLIDTFAMRQMGDFNKSEWLRTTNPDYQPRFYYMRQGEESLADHYYKKARNKKPKVYLSLAPRCYWTAGFFESASVSGCANNPVNDTDTDLALKAERGLGMMWNRYMETSGARRYILDAQDERNPGLRFDGLLYTNNAIFFLATKSSATKGAALINGSMIAADVGILVPGYFAGRETQDNFGKDLSRARGRLPTHNGSMGLRIHHDPRLSSLIDDIGGQVRSFEGLSSHIISREDAETLIKAAKDPLVNEFCDVMLNDTCID